MSKFNFYNTIFTDAKVIQTFQASDCRGDFTKDFSIADFESHINFTCVESMFTHSKKGVIRGMHFQEVLPQAKLVTCLSGRIYDVIVDIRPNSPTFLMNQAFELTPQNHLALYIPEGFAHGYLVLEDSIVSYKCNNPFYQQGDNGIRFDDPDFNIDWGLDRIGGKENVILSDKDANLQYFSHYQSHRLS